MHFIIIVTTANGCGEYRTDAAPDDIETAMFDAETMVSKFQHCHQVVILKGTRSNIMVDAIILDNGNSPIAWNYPDTVRRYVDAKIHALCHLQK